MAHPFMADEEGLEHTLFMMMPIFVLNTLSEVAV